MSISCAMLERQTWEFINTFSGWLSALGTLLAVVISLYLARRDRMIRLHVSVGLRQLVVPGQGSFTDLVTINIVNRGYRAVTVTGIEWHIGFFRRVNFVQVPPSNSISAKLPIKLSDGDEAALRFSLPEFSRGVESIVKALVNRRMRSVAIRSIRAGVSTSSGNAFLTRLELPLRKWFSEQVTKADNLSSNKRA